MRPERPLVVDMGYGFSANKPTAKTPASSSFSYLTTNIHIMATILYRPQMYRKLWKFEIEFLFLDVNLKPVFINITVK